jgi:hypothetical protein
LLSKLCKFHLYSKLSYASTLEMSYIIIQFLVIFINTSNRVNQDFPGSARVYQCLLGSTKIYVALQDFAGVKIKMTTLTGGRL